VTYLLKLDSFNLCQSDHYLKLIHVPKILRDLEKTQGLLSEECYFPLAMFACGADAL